MKPILILAATMLGSCGTNVFEREVELERVAVGLVRETHDCGYELITATELHDALAKKEALLLIDAMPSTNYAEGHLPGAQNFPFPTEPVPEWSAEGSEGKTMQDYEALLGPDKSRPIVVYCGYVACARSHNAGVWARRLGYQQVWRFAGGARAWKGAGYGLQD
jgi:thiosulfate/3-mercaptopyruvate sulfurtransferase